MRSENVATIATSAFVINVEGLRLAWRGSVKLRLVFREPCLLLCALRMAGRVFGLVHRVLWCLPERSRRIHSVKCLLYTSTSSPMPSPTPSPTPAPKTITNTVATRARLRARPEPDPVADLTTNDVADHHQMPCTCGRTPTPSIHPQQTTHNTHTTHNDAVTQTPHHAATHMRHQRVLGVLRHFRQYNLPSHVESAWLYALGRNSVCSENHSACRRQGTTGGTF